MTKDCACLVGFMGTGKSAAGRVVAARLGMTFVELDAEIEAAAGKSIPAIFAEDGEIRFRELEMQCIKACAARSNTVFSLGGGAVTNQLNLLYMRQNAVIIKLDARPDVILARVSADGHEKRPMLDPENPLGGIERLLQARAPFYAAATPLAIDTSDLDLDAVAHAIIDTFTRHRGDP